jgi:FixJ family two-component response regulator
MVLELNQALLEMLGYTVLPALTPAAALQLAANRGAEIELLITDVIMPGMNGRQLAQKLLETMPRLACLYVSGYTASVITRHGVLDEQVHFLQKPFSLNDLAAKVRAALDARPPERP